MNVYLIRHGESEANVANVHQDGSSKLTETGREQARFLAERVSKLPIDIIYSSPMTRAKETAEIINAISNKSIEFNELFREVLSPSALFGIDVKAPLSAIYTENRKKNFSNPDWKQDDGESFNERIGRARQALDLLESSDKENILVVTHGTFMKKILSLMMFGTNVTQDEDEKFRRYFWSTNTGITVCDLHDGRWQLRTFNDFAHLAE